MKGLKTLIVSLLLAVFGVLEGTDLTQFLSEENAGLAVTIIAVIMAGLRVVTTTPVLKDE